MIVSKQSYFSHLFIDIGYSFVIENIERLYYFSLLTPDPCDRTRGRKMYLLIYRFFVWVIIYFLQNNSWVRILQLLIISYVLFLLFMYAFTNLLISMAEYWLKYLLIFMHPYEKFVKQMVTHIRISYHLLYIQFHHFIIYPFCISYSSYMLIHIFYGWISIILIGQIISWKLT